MLRKPPERLIRLGRVADAYGVRGWVKVAPDAGMHDELAGVAQWWLGTEAFQVAEARVHGATVIARLDGVGSREQALALRGRQVAVQREALPEPEAGRYYLADLVGLEVVNERGEGLGVVMRTYWNGAQDVIEVGGKRTRLIPWVAAVVKEVDLPRRQIRVEWEADW